MLWYYRDSDPGFGIATVRQLEDSYIRGSGSDSGVDSSVYKRGVMRIDEENMNKNECAPYKLHQTIAERKI